jgi:predicted ATPase
MESAALPAQLTSLVGRDAEVRAAGRLLTAGHRLVSLVGAAGSGKTRLAVAVAAAVTTPVWFVDLTTMRTGGHTDRQDPAGDAAGFVLDAFGAARRPDLDAVDTLAAVLTGEKPSTSETQPTSETSADGQPVLLFDNCEHVTGPVAALAARLLATTPDLRILVTSRQPLGLPEETVVTVAPLDDDTALRLFETRMFERTGRPLPPAHRPAAATICRALDGLPLAVELAAARAALLSVPEVHRLLTDRFRVLADAKATGPEHHRTLRAALDWSFELLSPDKQALLRQLAVFQGGWSPSAAAALPAFRPGLLDALAERCLIDPQDSRGRMLQTVAAYATTRLAEVPAEDAAARDAHAAFFLDLAEQAAAGIRGPGQRDLLRILTLEQDNLRAAMTWLARRPGHGAAEDLRLATALAPFQHFTGVYRQGRDWLSTALARRPDAAPEIHAAACSAAATLAMLDCDYPAAAALAERALAAGTPSDDVRVRGRLLTLLGSVERERADYPRSRRFLDEALTLYRTAGDAWGEGRAAQLAGGTAWLSGDFTAAAALLDTSLAAFRDLADDESVASTLTHLGAVAHFGGDQPGARRYLVEALDRFTELSFPEGIGWAQDLLGRVDLADAAVPAAAERLRASLSIHRRVGDRWRSASVLEAFAEARRRLDDPAYAAALLGAADVIRREIGAPTPACEVPARQETEQALRAALGETAFDRVYRFGTRTPVDELLDLSGSASHLALARPA